MKISDILAKIIDLDGEESKPNRKPGLVQMDEPEESDQPVMIPPLQQKLELLKKVAGVDNVYDQDQCDLQRIKKSAGLPVVFFGSDDNDVLG